MNLFGLLRQRGGRERKSRVRWVEGKHRKKRKRGEAAAEVEKNMKHAEPRGGIEKEETERTKAAAEIEETRISEEGVENEEEAEAASMPVGSREET